ncbi:MAG TPA: lytic transglycosylase domain-containing protein [Bryobacteraceae bacterium]|nr:lytic transglycosylase domain-containing protein [Bryobacteraceae bacterium]
MRRTLHLIGLSALALPVWAGEYAVLANGFQLHADRHEAIGANIRLYDGGGFIEIPAASITRFDAEEVTPAVTPTSTPLTTATSPQPEPAKVLTPMELAAAAAKKYSLPESFVRSVMKTESGFRKDAVSPKGALGLMQLMPETAKQMGIDAANPKENAEGGAEYLRELLARYQNDPDQVLLALAAYNAGPGAVERYHGVPPYRETRDYILRVLRNWDRKETTK